MKSDDIRFRGIHTVSPVHINDVIVSIPISLLFTLNDAKRIITSILPHDEKDVFSNLGPIDTLSLALILEHQNTESFWSPYLECLPSMEQLKRDIEMPLFWTSPDIDHHLQSSKVGQFMQIRLRSLKETFAEFKSIFHRIPYLEQVIDFTLDHWLWAVSIIWSRSFSVMIQHQKMKVVAFILFVVDCDSRNALYD